MNEISSKTGKVAVFPLKMNLQLFAGEETYPSLEESSEFRDDAHEFNAKMDKYVADRNAKSETHTETPVEPKQENEPVQVEEVVKPEVVDPEKPKQDSETNKAFQEMRKAREEAERIAREADERAKRADALIAEQYGHMGITTVEQYEAALRREQEAKDAERYNEAGLTPEEVEAIRNYNALKQQVAQQTVARTQEERTTQWNALYTAYPELVESSQAFNAGGRPDWYTPEMEAEIARGASPLAAYRNAHFETILQKTVGQTKEVAKQEALNSLNSKNHMKPNGSDGADVEHVEIDEQTMRMYRALNKGKSDAEIRKWHKKHAMGG